MPKQPDASPPSRTDLDAYARTARALHVALAGLDRLPLTIIERIARSPRQPLGALIEGCVADVARQTYAALDLGPDAAHTTATRPGRPPERRRSKA